MKKLIALVVAIIVILLLMSNDSGVQNSPNYVDPNPDEDIASVNR